MKELTNEDRGITLVALIITIVIMLILISVSTYSGIDTYKRIQVNKFVIQMQLIQTRVDELVEEGEISNLGADASKYEYVLNHAKSKGEVSAEYNIDSYKYFSSEDLKKLDLDDGIDDEVLINFTTREVVSINGIEYNGKRYYTQYKLPNGQALITSDGSQLSRELNFDMNVSIDGLNATVSIENIKITNATLSYKEEGDNYWKTITNYTTKGKNEVILISKAGKYEFKLTDNTTGKNSNEEANQDIVPDINKKEILLTNKPNTDLQVNPYNYALSSENWAYLSTETGDTYIWIPRFAYILNESGEYVIKFIRGNSNIATDNSNIGETWVIPNIFIESNSTGIWIKTEKKAGIDIVELINSQNIDTLAKI